MSDNIVYSHTRAVTDIPLFEGEEITVIASLENDVVGLSWQRSDRERHGHQPLQFAIPVTELRAILEAVDSTAGQTNSRH